jgi:hypothetical protein
VLITSIPVPQISRFPYISVYFPYLNYGNNLEKYPIYVVKAIRKSGKNMENVWKKYRKK